MKKFTALFLLFILSFHLHLVAADCEKFKYGKFKLVSDQGTFIIERKGEKQFEYDSGEKINATFNVKWITDCIYTLTLTEETYKANPGFREIGTLTVTIIEVKENSYVETTTSELSNFKLTDEITRIK